MPGVGYLHQTVRDAVNDPEIKARMVQVGAEPIGSTPAEFGKIVADQVALLIPLIRDLKLVPPQ